MLGKLGLLEGQKGSLVAAEVLSSSIARFENKYKLLSASIHASREAHSQ